MTGVQFASSYNDLVTSYTHTPPLALDEFGSSVVGTAWTGIAGADCSNWTSNSASVSATTEA